MKRTILTASLALLLCGTAGAQGIYQFKDPGFDSYTATSSSTEWHSFNEARTSDLGFLAGFAKQQSPMPSFTDKGHDGTGKSAKIYSKPVFGVNANGNLTTGTINMGDTNPKSSKNYNFTDRSGSGKCLFAGRPDAVTFWANFTPGGSPNGRGQFILHGDVDYRDPEIDSQAGDRVGKAFVLIPNTNKQWKQFTAEFKYDKVQPATQYLLASFTTNPEAGGSANDNLWIDDVTFVYYHALSSLTYNGTPVPNFSETTTSYDLHTQTYDATKLAYTVKGAGATAEKSFDSNTGLLTITVKGNDYSVNSSSVTTYTVHFAKPEVSMTYTNDLLVDLGAMGGQKVMNGKTDIKLIKSGDSYSFLLEDFNFQGIEVGDIRVDNLTATQNGDGSTLYTGQQEVTIFNGAATVPVTMNATVKGNQMTAVINIENVGTVTFAPSLTITGAETLDTAKLPDGLGIVALKRHFYQGWNTLCLPFDLQAAELKPASLDADVKAQEFVSSTEAGALNFDEATTLKAGKPYLVYFSADADLSDEGLTLYFTPSQFASEPTPVTYGNWTFTGNYAAAFPMNGLYGVADQGDGVQKLMKGGAHATLPATGAYFRSASATVTSAVLNFDAHTTGIGGVTTGQPETAGPVYNLQGVKVSDGSTQGLPAGLYIQGGRKVLVK